MCYRAQALRVILAAAAVISAGSGVSAADSLRPPTDAERAGLEEEARRIKQEFRDHRTYPGPGSLDPGPLVHLGVIQAALGESVMARGSFLSALQMDRQINRTGRGLLPKGEGVFAPWFLENRWRTRDACLSFLTDPDAMTEVYERVWETKGDSTRLLERTYAAMRLIHATGRYNPYTPVDSELGERLNVRREIVRLMLEPAKDPAGRDARLGELFKRKESLMEWSVDGWSRTHVPQDLKDVHEVSASYLQRALGKGRVFIDLLRYGRLELDPARPGPRGERYVPSYLAFVVGVRTFGTSSDDGIRRVDLGPCPPIDAAIVRWRRAIERGEDAAEQAEAEAVGRLVWAPIAKVLPAATSTIYLSPDGQLGTLPWAALPGRRPGSVLLEDYALAQVPDGHYLLRQLLLARTPEEYDALQRQARRRIDPLRGMSLTDQFELAIRPRRPADDRSAVLTVGGVHADLPASAREVARIKQLAGGRPVVELVGAAATPERLMGELPKVTYAHLATHGFFAEEALLAEQRPAAEKAGAEPDASPAVGFGPRYPLAYTGLLLAGPLPGSGIPDRVLTSETIPELDLVRMRLCVLSACRTGLGDATSGEGVQGLVRAFHLAGCADVVASLWNVNDDAAEPLMAEFYRQLWQEKQPPIEALRAAQLELFRHPERVLRSTDQRGAPLDPNVTKPVNTSRPAAAGQVVAPRTSPPKWWAAFLLSGAGR